MSNIKVTTNGLFNPPKIEQPTHFVIGKSRRVGQSYATRQHIIEMMEYYANS